MKLLYSAFEKCRAYTQRLARDLICTANVTIKRSNAAQLLISIVFLVAAPAFGQIAQRGAATTATTTSTTLTINKPSGLTAGDIMIVQVVQSGNNNVSSIGDATRSGWTQITGSNIQAESQDYCRATLLYKIATASDVTASNFTFTLDANSDDGEGAIVAFSGVDNTTPFDVTPGTVYTNIANDNQLNATGISTVTAHSVVIMFGAYANNYNVSGWSAPNLITPIELFDVPFDATQDTGAGAASWAQKVITGPTGDATASLGSGNDTFNGSILIALRKACSSTTATPVITTTPLCSGATTVSGTSSEVDGTIITVFNGITSLGTTTVTGGGWTKTGLSLANGNIIAANAGATAKCTSATSSSVTVFSTPAQPNTISGPTPVCPNIGNISYSVSAVIGADSYNWTVPAGWTITSVPPYTNSISVTSGAIGQNGNIAVSATNSCGTGTIRTLAVTVVDANDIGFSNNVNTNTLTICAGTSGTIIGGNPTDSQTYQWQVANNIGFSNIFPNTAGVVNANSTDEDWAISSLYYNNPGTYYFRRVISGNTNCNGNSDVVTLVVSPFPAAPGTPASNSPQCNAVTLTRTGVPPADENWYWQTSATGTSTTNSGTTFDVTSSGTYYIRSQNSTGCWSIGSASLAVVVNLPPNQPGSITGNTCVVPNASYYIYSIGSVSGATSYSWTVPAGWIINNNTGTSIEVTTGTSGGAISVTANNTCGSSTARTSTVSVSSVNDIGFNSDISINALTICRGVNPTIVIGGDAGSFPNYQWQVSTAGPTTGFNNASGSTDNNEDYTVDNDYYDNAGTYYFRRVSSSSGCNGNSDVVVLTVGDAPAQPSVIIGNLFPCAGTEQTYYVDNLPGVGLWEFPSGWVKLEELNNSITLLAGSASGAITVKAGNDYCYGPARTLQVSPVIGLPVTLAAIAGSETPCQGPGKVYSVTNVPGVTYEWALPANWTITSTPTNASSITVTVVGSAPGVISVTPSNSCGTGGTQTLNVSPTTVPAQPSAITGNIAPCQGSQQIYSVALETGVTYAWTKPSNWTGTSTSNSITLTVGAGSGDITVIPSNSCGNGSARTLAVVNTTVPAQPSAITGNITPCQGSSETYSVTNVSDVTYTWILPSGWTGPVAGNSISVTVGSGSGDIKVTPSNGCGNGTASTLAVATNIPPTTTGATICQGGSGSLTSSTACYDKISEPNFPTTVATSGTGTEWASLANVGADDDANATSTTIFSSGNSKALNATGFGFAIPNFATINGIEVKIGRNSPAGVGGEIKDVSVSLLKSSGVIGNNHAATTTIWPTVETVAHYGATNDVWGTTWAPSEINSPNFGVSLIVNCTGTVFKTANVDYMQIIVTYTVPGSLDWYTASSGGSLVYSGSSFNPNINTPGTTTFYAACSSSPSCRTAADFVVNAKPNFTVCPENIKVDTEAGTCTATGSFTATASGAPTPVLTYSFTGVTTANGSETGSGSVFNKGITDVAITAANICGSAECKFSVTVEDKTTPEVLTQDITVQLDATGNASTTPEAVDNGSSDACGIESLSLSKMTFDCSNVGANIVTLTVTDKSGNVSTKDATVTVEDKVAPIPIAKNVTVQLDATGSGLITAEAVDNGSSDACGIQSLSLSKTAFDCSNVGANIVTLTVTDENGNVSTKDATVVVEDKVAPIALARNITVELDDTGNGSTTVAAVDDGSSDACGIESLSLSKTVFDCSNVGANIVTLTVTDNNDNVSTKDATVTVEDKVAPIAIGQNIIVQLDATGNASTTAEAVDNGSHDACGIESLSLSKTDFGCSDVLSNPNPVILTVTDKNGNVSTATANVTVKDEVPPLAKAKDVIVMLDATGNGTTTAQLVDDGSSDACGIKSLSLSKTDFSCSDISGNPNLVTLTVTDNNGNISTATANVTVKDEVAPTAITQNVTIQLDDTGNASTSAAAVDNGSSDACGIKSLSLSKTAFDCSNIGANTVTLTVTDLSGNVSTMDATVTVEDNVKPIFVTPSDITLSACQSTATWTLPVANDNCPNVLVEQTEGPASGSTFNPDSTTTISYKATDLGGNISTCSFTIKKQPTLELAVSNSNPQLYFGYSLDQSTVIKGMPSGGKAPYTMVITMNRPLQGNMVTSAGDEIWTPGGNTAWSSNYICPATGSLTSNPVSTSSPMYYTGGNGYSITATLMANATFSITVTDADGCSVTKTTQVNAEDARCFAGKSSNVKVKICHRTGNSKDPCHEICVDPSAVQAHLDHGDFVGTCTSNCLPPAEPSKTAKPAETIAESPFEVKVYPNPSDNLFTLELAGGNKDQVEISIYDVLGRWVKHIHATPEQPMVFGDDLPIGSYFVIISQGENKKTVKLLKN